MSRPGWSGGWVVGRGEVAGAATVVGRPRVVGGVARSPARPRLSGAPGWSGGRRGRWRGHGGRATPAARAGAGAGGAGMHKARNVVVPRRARDVSIWGMLTSRKLRDPGGFRALYIGGAGPHRIPGCTTRQSRTSSPTGVRSAPVRRLSNRGQAGQGDLASYAPRGRDSPAPLPPDRPATWHGVASRHERQRPGATNAPRNPGPRRPRPPTRRKNATRPHPTPTPTPARHRPNRGRRRAPSARHRTAGAPSYST